MLRKSNDGKMMMIRLNYLIYPWFEWVFWSLKSMGRALEMSLEKQLVSGAHKKQAQDRTTTLGGGQSHQQQEGRLCRGQGGGMGASRASHATCGAAPPGLPDSGTYLAVLRGNTRILNVLVRTSFPREGGCRSVLEQNTYLRYYLPLCVVGGRFWGQTLIPHKTNSPNYRHYCPFHLFCTFNGKTNG